MEAQDYIEANRQSWDEAAPVHAEQKLADLLAGFAKPGYSCLDEIETAILEKIGVEGKAVAQLCCNNGREVLSVVNMGAARGVGRSAEHTSELQSLMRISYAVFCLQKKLTTNTLTP